MKTATHQAVDSWRFRTVLVGMGLLALFLVYRILSLQVLDGARGQDFLKTQGDNRSVRTATIPANRGMITDRNGQPLAVTTPVDTIWANPKELVHASIAQKRALAQALGMTTPELQDKLELYRNKGFMYLRRHLPPPEAQAVMAIKAPGVYRKSEFRRFYPAGDVTAHLLGFTDVDDRGQEGMELAFDEVLRGQPGQKRVLKDLHGNIIQDIQAISSPRPGQDLQLSIDLRLQYVAYRELKAAVANAEAAAGSIVVLDTRTGEVLAMANYPSYNPNNRGQAAPGSTRNRALTDLMEPGSTIKPFAVAAGLEAGKFKPDTPIDAGPGQYAVDGKLLKDPVNYGLIDVTRVITKSSQVGIAKIALSLEDLAVRNMLERMGFGSLTETNFPGEAAGVLPNHRRWNQIQRVTLAFGHGLSVTPAQLAQAYMVFANRGIKNPITMLKQDTVPTTGQRVLSEPVAEQMLPILETVTNTGGTATRAQIPGYRVGGKTGTAHKVGAGGYEKNRYRALFAGFAPVSDPRIVAVVVIDDPQGKYYKGGQVAAPAFAPVVGAALRLMNVPPDAVIPPPAQSVAQVVH